MTEKSNQKKIDGNSEINKKIIDKIRGKVDNFAAENSGKGFEKFGYIENQKKIIRNIGSAELFENLSNITNQGVIHMSIIEKQNAEMVLQEIIDRLSDENKTFSVDDLKNLKETIKLCNANHSKIKCIQEQLKNRLTVKLLDKFVGPLTELPEYLNKEV